ncbi:MAG: maleylacetoacetate isomerase [Gammaproteobacteria bacterium RIFCSPHIGHO2_12_FULL_45_9]|nr:MAG: maleylacetoacetate isomerase [Gammaproteobacteria bacterium RIFCSPHIGHO2_12_FULL_45_9]
MLQLFDYFRSSASFRVRVALNLKGLPYDLVPIHLVNHGGEHLTPEYQTINPSSLVPTLKEGDKVLTQSLAIIEYLNDLHPEPPLLPSEPYEKALVRAFSLSIAADIHPLNNLRVLTYLTDHLNLNEAAKTKWYQHWITKGFSALETQLNAHPHSFQFCFGHQPSLADICLVPQCYNARRFNCDLSPYPTLMRIDQTCQQHKAFEKAWPTESAT